ncbi:MAG: hypothetical protein ACLU0O_05430 [Collinsella sp.]
MLTALTASSNEEYVQYLASKRDEVEHDLALKSPRRRTPTSVRPQATYAPPLSALACRPCVTRAH